ncbi:MAG: site-specific integrase [Myxococcota bacterium]
MARAKVTQYRGSWAVRWRTTGGKQKLKRCQSKRAAESLQAKIQYHLDLGEDYDGVGGSGRAPAVGPTIPTIIGAYVQERLPQLSAATQTEYKHDLRLYRDFLREEHPDGPPPLTALGRPLHRKFLAWLQLPRTQKQGRTRKAHVAADIVSTIQSVWAWADEEERPEWDSLPAPRRIKKPKKPEQPVTAPTYAEFDQMLLEVLRPTAPRAKPVPLSAARILLWARFTGMRREAITQLSRRDIDLHSSPARIIIPAEITKGRYGGRTLPLHRQLALLYATWGAETDPLPGLPFHWHTRLSLLSDYATRAWRRTDTAEAVYFNRTMHCARNMIETEWATAGVNQPVIDLMTGHADHSMAARYRAQVRLWPALVRAVSQMPPLHPRTLAAATVVCGGCAASQNSSIMS